MEFDRRSGPKELGQNDRLLRMETALESATLVVQAAEWVEVVNGRSPSLNDVWERYFAQHESGVMADGADMSLVPALCPFLGVIDAISGSGHLALTALMDQQITLSLQLADGSYRTFHGYVVMAANLGSDNGRTLMRLGVAAFTHFLSLRQDSRVFVQKSVREIVESVLAAYPQANFQMHVSQSEVRGITTQYGETDAAFVARLLAQEGWNWYLTHPNDGPALSEAHAAKHCLVITDARQASEALGAVRFNRSGVMRDNAEVEDTITHLSQAGEVAANALAVGSWDPGQLAGVKASSTASDTLAQLEVYLGGGERAHAQHDVVSARDQAHTESAERRAQLLLLQRRLEAVLVHGQGSVRHLKVFSRFDIQDHPRWKAEQAQHQVLSIHHRAVNELKVEVSGVERRVEVASGLYEQMFTAVPQTSEVVPPEPLEGQGKPVLHTELAMVVGWDEESFGPVTSNRDQQVRIQYPWQRGIKPVRGGLTGPSTPAGEVTGHAPGTAAASVWVRVGQPSAGANWGASLLPRVGTEVLIEFDSGDIDRPIVVGQLHGELARPPWPTEEGTNHAGVISGVHSQSHQRDGVNQWLMDDSTGQLRMRLASVGWKSAWSELSLGHLVSQGAEGDPRRGAWLGSGYYGHTDGWAVVRAQEGLLLSTSARPGGQGSQMDAAEAVKQLQSAQALGTRLGESVSTQGGVPLTSFNKEEAQALETLRRAMDPKAQGRYEGAVGGQEAKAAKQGSRELEADVPRFCAPHVVMQTAGAGMQMSEGPISAYSGMDTSVTAQDDLQVASARTVASVSGQTSSVVNHQGPMRLITAKQDFSLAAHTDALELLASELISVQSVNGDIEITARKRIELRSLDSKVVLDGENIDYHCNEFVVHSSTHEFSGPAAGEVNLEALPDSRVKAFDEAFVLRDQQSGQPLAQRAYRIVRSDGTFEEGITDALGRTHAVSSTEAEELRIEFLQED